MESYTLSPGSLSSKLTFPSQTVALSGWSFLGIDFSLSPENAVARRACIDDGKLAQGGLLQPPLCNICCVKLPFWPSCLANAIAHARLQSNGIISPFWRPSYSALPCLHNCVKDSLPHRGNEKCFGILSFFFCPHTPRPPLLSSLLH